MAICRNSIKCDNDYQRPMVDLEVELLLPESGETTHEEVEDEQGVGL